MTLTLLLDLDDTLLETNMGAFIPAYFQALSNHLQEYVPAEKMLPALMKGTELMLASEDPTRTLQEVFESYFYPQLGVPKEKVTHRIEQFYDEVYPSLGSVTKKREGAVELLDWALARGYRVAVATDPLFPRKAIHHRIRWAGLDPERFELVSSFETFHFTKSHPAYFAEVLGRLGWPSEPVLMVGNDVDRDLKPAQSLGLKTYHVNQDGPALGSGSEAGGSGKLSALRSWLESTDLGLLEPSMQTPFAILAVMLSTPAILQSLVASVPDAAWPHKPIAGEWALVEVVCHLRDTEREIHQLQANMLLEEREPFIPRPDSTVWAKERNYLKEDGRAALRSFASARLATLAKLKGLNDAVWGQKARHAIFGPTHFREVIGFMADHDRMHIQQAWNILRTF
ncbi:MAG TPA: DinB family protein [Anaerolineales bacterium]|nr:DinB family protein [Anaerolineales bacterium]